MADGYKPVGDGESQYVPPDGASTGDEETDKTSTTSTGNTPVPGSEQQGGFSYDPVTGQAPAQPQHPGPIPGSFQSTPTTPQGVPPYQPYQQPYQYSQPQQPFGQPAYGGGYGQDPTQLQPGVAPSSFGQPADASASSVTSPFQSQQPGAQSPVSGAGAEADPNGVANSSDPFGIPPYAGDASAGAPYASPQPQTQPTTPLPGASFGESFTPAAGGQPSAPQDDSQPPSQPTGNDPAVPAGAQPTSFASGPVPPISQTPGVPQNPGAVPPNVPPLGGQPPYGGYQQPGQPPQGQSPYGAPMPPAPKKSNKKLVIGLSIAGGIAALIVIVLVVLAFLPSGKPTADDYTNALNQTSKISNRYYSIKTKLNDVYSVSYDPSKNLDDKDISSLKQKVKDYQSAVSDFGKQDKIMKDENVKTKYDAYVKASDKYASYINGLADSALPMSKAVKACSDTPSSSLYESDFYDKYNQYISDCSSSLDELSKAKDTDVAKYGTDMKDYIGKLGELIGKMQALGNPNDLRYGTDQYNQMNDLQDEYYDLSSDGYNIDSDFSKALQETEDKMNPEDELNDLRDAVQDGFHDALSR
ncbi:hypothetical protein [Bifidobacterium callimiconis]|uniref:Uncharacterized protein n=1 Tax=Bifidobacterium callimiconis TaxID=2306973 RepID=A0A430FI01_9BIFI|nr:hypothetical protein [Bifidobacterium callimiconis]MBT1176352.1 hypothetical protein [Bifidobacterium callimiconis]RSX52525.1 hypothetical protein D2E23_0253 [Bifidobacterium callimiconis]